MISCPFFLDQIELGELDLIPVHCLLVSVWPVPSLALREIHLDTQINIMKRYLPSMI